MSRKEGYLLKCSSHSYRGFQKRYFVLEDGRLEYFQTEQEAGAQRGRGERKHVMALEPRTTTTVEGPTNSQSGGCFVVATGARAWRLRGQTRIEMQAWILAIKAQASAANDRTAAPRADEDQKATPGDAPSPAPAKKRSSSFMGLFSRSRSSPKDDAEKARTGSRTLGQGEMVKWDDCDI